MRQLRCTIDSSCLIALDHLNLIPKLSVLFSAVLVPKAVRQDVYKRRTMKDRFQSILDSYAFVQRCDSYDQGAVDVLLVERSRRGIRDRGETEAVVQASQFGATVIVDDPWGRNLAARHNLEFHGTVWVLERLQETELISGAALRACFVTLRSRGIRLPLQAVNELLGRIGEQALQI